MRVGFVMFCVGLLLTAEVGFICRPIVINLISLYKYIFSSAARGPGDLPPPDGSGQKAPG